MTPINNPTPTVSFILPDTEKIKTQLDKTFGERVVSVRNFNQNKATGMRIGISVYNNNDVDQSLGALRS